MNTYFSTFITGFTEVVERSLKNMLFDLEIINISDGIVIYKTAAPIEKVKGLGFLNNTFALIKEFKNIDSNSIRKIFREIIQEPSLEKYIQKFITRRTTFRIITKADQMVAVDKNLLARLEKRISENRFLSVNRTLPDVEFWFLIRRDGTGFFGLRLTRRPNYEKTLEKGELYPELANIMCLISEPNKNDVFLDPFCGSGSIPIQRALSFPYKQVLAGDIEPKLIDKLRNKTKKMKQQIIIGKWDVLNLKTFNDSSVDKIVTDPPWGLHSGTDLNLPKFYSDMIREFSRVLKPNGFLVILVANKELFQEITSKYSNELKLLIKYDTLVSGQKAGVYKLVKNYESK